LDVVKAVARAAMVAQQRRVAQAVREQQVAPGVAA
jgi:hypothetical protein